MEPMRAFLFDLIRELSHGEYRVKWEMRVGLWLKPTDCVEFVVWKYTCGAV